MLPSNPICPVCNYATSAVYCDLPTPEQLANGVKPLDSLPAAWWNCMWSMVNCSVNQARGAVGSFITELNNVLAGAGICPNCVCTDQLYQAIDRIRQTIGNATVAGAVKSSATPGMVSIDNNGFMTANCVGNATQLATSARTLVGAVNELKTTYDTCFGSVSTALGGKAPTSHASSATTYGVGTASAYGHLRISGTYTSDLKDAGMAASQTALYNVYNYATQISAAAIGLGNIAGCPLGTASAGTAATAARSDHIHPLPKCVCYADCAICARCVCHVACTDAGLYHVALSLIGYSANSYVYVSCACPLTYCNTTGTLTAAQFCGNVCGTATCAINTVNISSTGFGTSAFTYFQALESFAGSSVGWAHYLISNHGNGSTYFNYIIREPFYEPPQYSRKVDGCQSPWYSFITAENIATQSVACATNATNATCATNAINATWATCAHGVIDYCNPTNPIRIAYAGPSLTASQVTLFAAYSSNLESGKTIIKDVSVDSVKQVLGLGSAAYCNATDFRPSSWTPSCVACAGVTYSFGNVTAARNPLMRTWSVYALRSGSISLAPECDIVKAICWATDNLSQGSYMAVSGYIGANTIICEIQKVTDRISVWIRNDNDMAGWCNLYVTCTRSWYLPISFGGSY